MNKPHFALQENIARNIVFVDGIARCGKSLFSNVIPTLLETEHLRFITMLEHIVPALSLGCIDSNFAKSSLRSLMNEIAYDTLLSRNANFRPDDQTGVLNYYDPKVYIQRLAHKEGDGVVDELRQKKRLFPFITHDMMVNLEYLDALSIDYKMVHIYRHPVDNIYSWYKRGWGERFQSDPRSFTLSIEYHDEILPWYCVGYEEEWLHLNPMERCVRTVLDLLERSVAQHRKARYLQCVHTLTFECFVQNTEFEMHRISKFLERDTTPWTAAFLGKACCPRVLNPSDRSRKLKEFRSKISKNLYVQLTDSAEKYECDTYGLSRLE